MGTPSGYRLMCGAALAIALAGCGPIEYINTTTRKASGAVEAAKAVDADKYSPYYYTRAVEYLHKSREEAASADYQAANRFGRLSHEAALKAKEQALERAGKPIEQFHPKVVGDDDDDAGKKGMAPLDPAGSDDDSGGDDAEEPPPPPAPLDDDDSDDTDDAEDDQ